MDLKTRTEIIASTNTVNISLDDITKFGKNNSTSVLTFSCVRSTNIYVLNMPVKTEHFQTIFIQPIFRTSQIGLKIPNDMLWGISNTHFFAFAVTSSSLTSKISKGHGTKFCTAHCASPGRATLDNDIKIPERTWTSTYISRYQLLLQKSTFYCICMGSAADTVMQQFSN